MSIDSPVTMHNDESAASEERDIPPNVSRNRKYLYTKRTDDRRTPRQSLVYVLWKYCISQVSSRSSISSPIDDESSVNDFLAKMDTSIANVKKELKRAQGISE